MKILISWCREWYNHQINNTYCLNYQKKPKANLTLLLAIEIPKEIATYGNKISELERSPMTQSQNLLNCKCLNNKLELARKMSKKE